MKRIENIAKGESFDIVEAIRLLASAIVELSERITKLEYPQPAEKATEAKKK